MPSRTGEASPGWQYAASPINWCNDDLLDLGDSYTLNQILQEMAASGVTGTELGRKYPRAVDALCGELQRYRLSLTSGWHTLHLADRRRWADEFQAYRQHLALLRAVGAKVVVTAEGSGSVHWDLGGDRPAVVPWDESAWSAVAAGLERAGEMCRDVGLRLVYHPHLGTNVQGPRAIQRLLEATDSDLVGLVLDTGHVYAGGGDPAAIWDAYAPRIAYLHLKDVRPPILAKFRAGLGFLDAVRQGIFTVPGDGVIDFAPLMKRLRKAGYAGWLVIEAEQDPALAPPKAYLERALRYLREESDGQRGALK